MSTSAPTLPQARDESLAALNALPETPERIPAFFFGHGSPMLAATPDMMSRFSVIPPMAGTNGPLAQFLSDFGPALLKKYKPKAIVVFSAHWETDNERLVTDYGDENPLLMDYYGFERSMYELRFSSRGDDAISARVVDLFREAGFRARAVPRTEPRGRDGRGFSGPGLDHGVFFPFRIMFGEVFRNVPIVQASIDGSLTPEANWAIGKAITKLRDEGILVLSGGLTVHNLRDFSSFSPETASKSVRDFNDAVTAAVVQSDPKERRSALQALVRHSGFKNAHPRAEHFIPIYVAAGAGEEGGVRVLSTLYGCHTVAFGL